jgi:nucleoside-diphosphate-sugar epimerase
MAAERLKAAGAAVQRGDLQDLDAIRKAVAACDAAVHTAFDNSNIAKFPKNSRIERAALQTMADNFAGTSRPLIAAGGFAPIIKTGPVFTEDDHTSPSGGPIGRNVERTIMRLAENGVNASIVRMPIVHGEGDKFTLRRFINFARKHGEAGYVGDGENLLPAVHVSDAARIYRLAIERGVPASRYHAVAESGIPYRAIAKVIGRQLHVPVVSMSPMRARRHFRLYAAYAQSDGPASSAITREALGWHPDGPDLLTDLDRAAYFEA